MRHISGSSQNAVQVELPYGDGSLRLEIPKRSLLGILSPKDGSPPAQELLWSALNSPLDAPSFKEFSSDPRPILVLVNDYTRPTPTAQILELLDFPEHRVRFVMALGSHRPPTRSECRGIFGRGYDRYRERIRIHDARDQSRLRFLGKTRRSTPVWVNQEVLLAHLLLLITSVEPHYFAGFTGGRKSFLPGVAGHETITCNHRWAVESEARTLALKGNPVHEDMVEAARMVPKPCFSIQVVVDHLHRIRAAFAGDYTRAFAAAVEEAQKLLCVPIPEPADVVVSLVQPPYDINFYQAQKALENARLGLKEGGILIFVSRCREGVGNDEFLKVMADAGSPKRTIEKVREKFVLGYQKSAKLAEILLSCQIFGVAGVDDEVLERAFIKPFKEINDALSAALAEKGKNAKVLILEDGSLTVPVVV